MLTTDYPARTAAAFGPLVRTHVAASATVVAG